MKEKIDLVETYVKENCPPGVKILSVTTTDNGSKGHKEAKLITVLHLEEEKTGLQASQTFNTLKIYRELKKKEKYEKSNLT